MLGLEDSVACWVVTLVSDGVLLRDLLIGDWGIVKGLGFALNDDVSLFCWCFCAMLFLPAVGVIMEASTDALDFGKIFGYWKNKINAFLISTILFKIT